MVSYQKISQKLLSFLHIETDNQTEADIYLYGMEILLSGLVNFTIILSLSLLLHMEKEVICFFCFFAPLRMFGGGIHAKNHIQCICLFLFCLFGSLFFAHFISQFSYYFVFVLLIASGRILWGIIQKHCLPCKNADIAMFFSVFLTAVFILWILFNAFFGYHMEYYITLGAMAVFIQLLTGVPILFRS